MAAIDIIDGDLLVIGSDEYPIRKANIWDSSGLANSATHVLKATVACSTKRSPTEDTDGFIGTPVANLTGLYCRPLDPVNTELARSEGIESAYELRYTIIANSTSFAQLFVEDVKRT